MDQHRGAHRIDDQLSVGPAGIKAFLAVDRSGGGGRTVEVFDTAAEAVAAAIDVRRDDPGACLAVHGGESRLDADGMHSGSSIRRCEVLLDTAGVGQILVTSRATAMLAGGVPDGWALHDSGVHRLLDLSPPERIYELAPAGGAGHVSPLRSLDTFPNNLPVQLTSFVGRQRELARIQALLAGERLVTITGAGGCGKTRLAAHAAASRTGQWRDGIWWVELATVDDEDAVLKLVAEATGTLVEPVRGALDSLTLQLRDRNVLLCLDNCEHVLDAAAALVEHLLRTCAEVIVLATSREPLGVPGEVTWRAPTLDGDESMALFLERASLVRPWVTLDAASESAVRSMCARLDGIPLAIELAAGWLRTLTPQQIARGLEDRLALLAGGPRGAPPRQQTLEASIDWSHDLLDASDRAVFRRLGVFAGGFAVDAARAVCGFVDVDPDDVLDILRRLVDKSFVVATTAPEKDAGRDAPSEGRFRLLEPIRRYALDRLDDADEDATVRDRHLDYFVAFVEAAEPELDRNKDAWRAQVEVEYENLRVALDRGLAAADPDRGRRLAAGLPWLWNLQRRGAEGLAYMRRAVERAPDDRSVLQAKLLTSLGLVADTTAPFDLGSVEQGLAIAAENGDSRLQARCQLLFAVGQLYVDFDESWRLGELAMRLAAGADEFVVDGALALHGIILQLRDRHDEAVPTLERAVEGLIRRADRGIASTALARLSDSALCTGNVDAAIAHAERAVEIAEPLRDYHRVGTSRSQLAYAHGVAGDLERAFRVLEPVVRLVDGDSEAAFVPGLARVLGTLRLWNGEIDDAIRWLEAEVGRPEPGDETYVGVLSTPTLGAALLAADRNEEAGELLERILAVARQREMPSVVADALHTQGRLLVADRVDEATDLFHSALGIRIEHGLRLRSVDSLDALADVAALCDDHADAVRLFAASDRARASMRYPRPPIDLPSHTTRMSSLLSALGPERFADAESEGQRLSLDEAVAYVRRTRGSRRRPATGWASLTPTELEVVQLVVEGLNNPDIGARLFMSRGTVKTHLSHVYAKVGVANRTELATLATSRLQSP